MEKNIYYPLDYGWYDSKEKWTSFCSSKCRCFSECSGKGGFCTSIERRDIQSENKDGRIPVNSGGEPRRTPLFWHFPAEAGLLQPWRRKLWELKK
ncbi:MULTISPECIES: hypothetical protein [Paenibacillus]|uniref:hypothetical protein n=1 Tax=Paenibacillus TaxID=44249 RepID=UPI00096FC49B|nr:hypothetical protein [Paenibacillus odorifer]OMC62725.1 hypothetical protein BK121_29840 [Paenibacillus odorifer]OMD68990.1 hypothetical protein BSK48_17635 [Paenibacillus odorifer]OMD75772.1 hypothetical protein BSK50_17505 [Paenibacillus odorifer]OMD79627.1 hypothetical protein BSK53_21920 [Paenibacillus odorifer]OMD91907.1 hypothetical protein BSK67_19945 [Paenibacillus odorifer]